MLFRKSSFVPVCPPPHYEDRENVVKDGFPPRVVRVEKVQICTNSETFRSSFPDYDPDQLEKDIAIGKDLKEVNPLIFTKQFIDSEEVAQLDKEIQMSNSKNE